MQVRHDIPLLFEDIKIHNTLVRPGKGACIDRHLSYNPDINLKYDQNGFSISFAALDYSESERLHHYYKLDGFDQYWINAHNNKEAYYANLPAGTYTFRVRITQNDQSTIVGENAIRVIVHPAPWATWWAYTFYLIAGITILAFFIRAMWRIRAEKQAVLRAEQAKAQEQFINKMNMSFFANISHEFRTPLTMISGPISLLYSSSDITGENKNLLRIVQRSVNRMLRLVNQMLDFNKLENDTLKLKVRPTEIVVFLKELTDIFRVNAESKSITMITNGLEGSFIAWIDEDKIDKIFTNLMSNALKYTPAGGRINVNFDIVSGEDAVQAVKIEVINTGQIPDDKLEKIFERYYQISDEHGGIYNWGTGIGLYYARSLARLHHGSLTASNLKDDNKVMFTLIVPVGQSAYSEAERSHEQVNQLEAFPLEENPLPVKPDPDLDKEKKTIMVVDDDSEVAYYLELLLGSDYQVVCRFNAESALEAITESVPDLILSDVVMPGKDGYWLCREIKESLQLCHIPVILVTAKTTIENQVEGLNVGVDAYVTKPFEPHYLMALIKSLLNNREKTRSLLSRSTQTDKMDENVLSPQDNMFMTELYHLMESELSNPELDVTRMTQLLKISRTKFYYKVKGLTGENPSVFFKTYKLNRAVELLKEGKYTISEIADMTGFNTLSHFSKSFKQQFGIPPSEYLK
jgi:signal transduction histidine kinase/DNA-binding response OmpR family regulator